MVRYLVLVLMGFVLPVSALAQNENAANNKDRYIVVLKDGVGKPADVAASVARQNNGRVGYVYETALRGFSVSVPPQALRGIQNNPNVAFIEKDNLVQLSVQNTPTGISRIGADGNTNLSINGSDDWRVDVDVAVLDTGIDLDHPDLNAYQGANCLQSSGRGPAWRRTYFCSDSVSSDDDQYHGTHVAGIIGALDNDIGVVGVAPGARLWAVKVLDSSGNGYTSGILAGIDWVVDQGHIEVMNLSLSGSGENKGSYETAITNAKAAGVTVVVAAGNNGDDAANYAPANVPAAITVSALADSDGIAGGGTWTATCRVDEEDTLANFSNYGSSVDIIAPGVCIESTVPGGYDAISGTSMAAPYVAGAAALLASSGANIENIERTLFADPENYNYGYGWTDESGDGVLEPLLNVANSAIFTPALIEVDGNPPVNTSPTADFSYFIDGLSVAFTDASSDADGSVTAWQWSFGEGNSSNAQNPNHTYSAAGSYTVMLTVTDNEGANSTYSEQITVTAPDPEPEPSDISLIVNAYKVKGRQRVDLTWSGTSTNVDIYRDGAPLDSNVSGSSYTDAINRKGGGSYIYSVCETGTNSCSDDVNASF